MQAVAQAVTAVIGAAQQVGDHRPGLHDADIQVEVGVWSQAGAGDGRGGGVHDGPFLWRGWGHLDLGVNRQGQEIVILVCRLSMTRSPASRSSGVPDG